MMRSVVGMSRLVPVDLRNAPGEDADFTEPAAQRESSTFARAGERVLASRPAGSESFFGVAHHGRSRRRFLARMRRERRAVEKVSPM